MQIGETDTPILFITLKGWGSKLQFKVAGEGLLFTAPASKGDCSICVGKFSLPVELKVSHLDHPLGPKGSQDVRLGLGVVR